MNTWKRLLRKSLSSLTALWFLAEFVTWSPQRAYGQSVQYAFSNFAGMPGGQGNVDGIGSAARFHFNSFDEIDLIGIAADRRSNIYVADRFNGTIRKITAEGAVTTVAGTCGQHGSDDGIGGAARFLNPTGVAVDDAGNVYVADTYNHTVRKITPDGVVTTLAGSPRQAGSADGIGDVARFDQPRGLGVDRAGNVYVADTFNATIRKITPSGNVTTLAGSPDQGAARFNNLNALTVDNAGNIYVTDSGSIWKVTGDGMVTALPFCCAQLGLAVDHAGNLFVLDYGDKGELNTIRKLSPGGIVTTVATIPLNESTGFTDPITNVAVDSGGNLYVAGYWSAMIWKVTPDGRVITLAGSVSHPGTADGPGSIARFFYPKGVAIDKEANVYVADTFNATIRKITPAGNVTTLAGRPGSRGSNDDIGAVARFNYPESIAMDSGSNVYVADTGNNTIRKITPTGLVTTLAGSASTNQLGNVVGGYADGTGSEARFDMPSGLAVDSTSNVYVADTLNATIRKITTAGIVTTLAGRPGSRGAEDGMGTTAQFDNPNAVAVDQAGNVYVADAHNRSIRKITPAGSVTTIAGGTEEGSDDGVGSAARFRGSSGLAVDQAGNVYVADTYNHTIRKITPTGAVTTIAGTAGSIGGVDGIGRDAQFSSPTGVAVDSAGNIYVVDSANNRITKGSPITVSTLRFGELSVSGGLLTATISEVFAGATVVLESSTSLRDWSPIETNVMSGTSLPVNRPINPHAGAEFLRAIVK